MSIDTAPAVEPGDHEFRIPTVRLTPDGTSIMQDLGLLADLEGSWRGHGFNLIARPDREGNSPLFLELNETEETLHFEAIGSSIPNRGFAMDDIELYGLTYLQKISDHVTKGALHIEPGIWIAQPNTTAPADAAPPGEQLIARMGSIPHGNAILAQGVAKRFSGSPTLTLPGIQYNGSVFPSFNSTPFAVKGPIFAAGTSEFDLPPPPAPAPAHGFSQYTLSNAPSATNPRTPFGNVPPIPLPATISGVAIQDVVNDPIRVLQAIVTAQLAVGHTFEGTVLNISSAATVTFATQKNTTTPTVPVSATKTDGGIENIDFLDTNAQSALVYATFWIEKVSHPRRRPFLQLQYAQMVLLNFPILGAPPGTPVLSWPHVSVATLTKDFH